MKFSKRDFNNNFKGQSFVELTLVISVLLLLFAGVVELGNLINIYLDIIDSAREAARAANTVDFLSYNELTSTWEISPSVYDYAAKTAWNTLNPGCQGMLPDKPGTPLGCGNLMRIPFDPATDDIVISVFSYNSNTNSLLRFPTGGWSRFGHNSSIVSDGEIMSSLDPTSLNTGMILVEVFYNYHQMLGLPFFADVLPDPIPVHVFSIMPYPLAEPTATPLP
jgi:hypothetical protein